MSDPNHLDAVRDLELALRSPTQPKLPRSALALSDPQDGQDAVDSLRELLVRMTVLRPFDGAGDYRFKDIDALYLESVRAECAEPLVEALNYLRLYQAVAGWIRRAGVGAAEHWFDHPLAPKAAAALLSELRALEAFEAAAPSSNLVLGKVQSLISRAAAAGHFSNATVGADLSAHVLRHDSSALTYFDGVQLGGRTGTGEDGKEIPPATVHQERICAPDTRFLVVTSCDRKYLRMYLPYWLTVAGYLEPSGFSFHFLITEADDDAGQLIEDARLLTHALARFRGYDPAQFAANVSFGSVATPADCRQPITFAACARLLYARRISELTAKRVISQDIDFAITHDPSPWFEALPTDRVGLTANRVNVTIDPWRKFLGGTFVLPHSEAAFSLARRLERYILHGLPAEYSWCLDQNALAYLYDSEVDSGTAAETLTSLNGLGMHRPTRGFDVHYLFKLSENPPPVARDGTNG